MYTGVSSGSSDLSVFAGSTVLDTDLNVEIGLLTTVLLLAGILCCVFNCLLMIFSLGFTNFSTDGTILVGREMNLSSSVDTGRGWNDFTCLGRLGLDLIGDVTTGTGAEDDRSDGD